MLTNRRQSLLTILLLNLLVYSYIIFLYPGFYTDDYILFTIIHLNPEKFFLLKSDYPFYLFLRPVSYFTFWLDYQLWGNNPFLIKLTNLIYHLILVYNLFRFFETICQVFKIELNYRICFLSIFLFSFHLDVLYWNNWISDRTELLYLLFYIASLRSFFQYCLDQNNRKLFLFLLFYILSVGAKQTGSHLPFLLLLFLYYSFTSQKICLNKKAFLVLALSGIIFFITVVTNLYFAESSVFLNNIWKKPFTIIGIFIHTLIPICSQNIYNYFLMNKAYVLVSSIISILLIIIFIKKNRI